MRRFILLLALVTYSFQEACYISSGARGTCISTSKCSQYSGTSHAGYCSGGNDIQCCVNVHCGSTGICRENGDCAGSQVSGSCPGDNDFKCCKNIPCDSGKGTCMWSGCSGTSKSGLCPGPNGFKCCSGSSPDPEPTPSGSGAKIVSAARKMVGKYPYSWAGGNNNGATYGIVQDISPYCDDSDVIGFDCSGLAKYAVYQGTGVSLYHQSQVQYDTAKNNGQLVDIGNRKAGDLVFFGSSSSSIHHVAIYSGEGTMIEAPGHNSDCSGMLVREKELRTSQLISKAARFW